MYDYPPPSIEPVCALLNVFAVRHRYPASTEVNGASVLESLETVEMVQTIVGQRFLREEPAD